MKRIFIIFVIFAALLTLSSCNKPWSNPWHLFVKNAMESNNKVFDENKSTKNEELFAEGIDNFHNKRYTTLYYQDSDGLLIPITKRTDRIEGIARAALLSIVDNPLIREDISQLGLYPVIPTGTKINGLTIKEETAIVDFTEQFLDYPNKDTADNALKAVIYTLTEFSNVKKVKVLVNNNIYGELFVRKGINNDSIQMFDETKKEFVNIFLTKLINNKHRYMVPIGKTIDKSVDKAVIYKMILNELIKEQTDNKMLKNYLPAGLVVNGIQIDGQTVIVDFNEEIIRLANSIEDFDIALKQILCAFNQFDDVKWIKINVNGKSMELKGENAGKVLLEVPQHINII